MKVQIVGGPSVALTKNEFLAQGGEGSIYVKGGTAFKIYHDPAKMIPVGKIEELAKIQDNKVIRPLSVLMDEKKNAVGVTYSFIPDAESVCKLFTKAFKDRNGINLSDVGELVHQMRETVQRVHDAHILIVDLNELNLLLDGKTFKNIYFIDTDSWQTPHFKATAIMDYVRDRKVVNNNFTELSDWFSFGVVTFQMFMGIHPYKGTFKGTPILKDVDERMNAGVSVFNKDVSLPKVCPSFGVIPKGYLDWYERVFERGERIPPPLKLDQIVIFVSPTPVNLTSSGRLVMDEINSYGDEILGVWDSLGSTVVKTSKEYYVSDKKTPVDLTYKEFVFFNTRNEALRLQVHPPTGNRIDAHSILDLARRPPVEMYLTLNIDQVMTTDGRLYAKCGALIVEIAAKDICSMTQSISVLPNATKLYEGVAIQDLLGTPNVTIFPKSGTTYQFNVAELIGSRIISAKFDCGVLMVIGASKKGKFSRFVFRFAKDYSGYDVRVVNDVDASLPNFVTTDTGVCICLTHEEKLEVFSSKMGSPQIQTIEDQNLSGDMILVKLSGRVGFYRGNKLYRLQMK